MEQSISTIVHTLMILIDVECSYIDEWVGTEYNVELVACYRPLLDGKGVKKVDFLDVQ